MAVISELIHYYVAPPLLILVMTPAVIGLVWLGNPDVNINSQFITGNTFSWKFVSFMLGWAVLSLIIPSKRFKGPASPDGHIPEYQANGLQYYIITTFITIITLIYNPELSVEIVKNYGPILASLSIVAFTLCIILLVIGYKKLTNAEKTYPLIYQFYRGTELHASVFGVDIKQLTVCRIGLMLWQILILVYWTAGWYDRGWNAGHTVNVALQTVYLAKFYYWETGYFNTLDITLDRAGYYLCWGCLVYVPSLYTFTSYFFVRYSPNVSQLGAVIIFCIGLLSVFLNYAVDQQKEYFKLKNGKCQIWGKPATYIKAEYKSPSGNKTSPLLTSGFWGIARHLNYLFELSLAYCCSLPSLTEYGIWPYLQSIFLTILLIHRVYRDEEKCSQKYGIYWKKYCSTVKYRIIPGIW